MEEARRSEESKSRGRFARGRAHARWGSEAEGGTRLHRRNALGRTGQDGPRENEDEISDGGSRMDGRTRGKRVRICLLFSAGETAGSYRFGAVVRILTFVSRMELFRNKFRNSA